MNKWTTGEVAKLRNIYVRTLRYYNQIDLLNPSFKDEYGKRFYSEEVLDFAKWCIEYVENVEQLIEEN